MDARALIRRLAAAALACTTPYVIRTFGPLKVGFIGLCLTTLVR